MDNATQKRKRTNTEADPSQDAQLELLRSGAFSDMKIVCGDRTWNLHRCVVAPRCEFFNACNKHGHQEHTGGIVEPPDDDAGTIQDLLEYLYTLKFPGIEEVSTPQNALRLLSLIRVADKYDVSALVELAKERAWNMICNTKDFEVFAEIVQIV